MERQASSENPVTDFSMNRLRTGTLPSSPAEAPIAHLMLGALHSEPILGELASSGPGRLAAALRGLAAAVLDAPAVSDAPAAAAAG